MNDRDFFLKLYRLALNLYPSEFRKEFGDELEDVFIETLLHAQNHGTRVTWGVFSRELRDVIRTAINIRFPGRLKEETRLRVEKEFSLSASRWQQLLTLAVFILPGMFIFTFGLLPSNPPVWSYGLMALFPLIICAVLFAGFAQGLPRWSLPYVGLGLSIISFLYVFNWVADLFFPSQLLQMAPYPLPPGSRLVLQCLWSGFMWLVLIVLIFLTIKALALVKRFHLFYWRIQRDWTQASFIVYGGSSLALVLLYKEYHYQTPFAIASWLCLATGAWLYLASPRISQRATALIGGVTLAMWTSAAGIITRVTDHLTALNQLNTRLLLEDSWFTLAKILLEWGWMVVFLLAPALIPGFQMKKDSSKKVSTPPQMN